jgi:predicted tellurium resistance membrane protein TerC
MAQHLWVMVAANVIALARHARWPSKSIAEFVEEHPTVKILALSFLLMIGLLLVAEGFEIHVPKGYVYFAMAYSVASSDQHPHRRGVSHTPDCTMTPT